MPGKNPQLPPTPALTEYEFEDFIEALMSAHRYCSKTIVRVRDIERWGRRGDKQDGIDFKGTLSDGTTVAWQCKRQDNLTPSDVRAAVAATTYTAEKYFLVYSGEASTRARNEIANHTNWELLDQRGLARTVDDLPLARRRELLDKIFGRTIRKSIIDVPGEDAFWTIETFQGDRHNPDTILNDVSPLVGRSTELDSLRQALDRSTDEYPIVIIVTGPGGRGKTRLVTDVLAEHQETHPDIPVLCLAPSNTFDKASVAELPHSPAVVFIDDAHHDPIALGNLLTYARVTPGTQVVLAIRPSADEAIRTVVTTARFAPSDQAPITVAELSAREARQLVTQLAAGLDLNLGARNYLAEQATHSPDLAVITTNLIRRGELTNALPLDEGLRAQVLSSYRELRTAGIPNFGHDTVRRILATYTALRPDVSNLDLVNAIAIFCDIKPTQLLRLNHQLSDRGLITATGNATRVVPDLLADTFLEDEAAAGADDLGFTTELWDSFAASHRERLITALAELGWRLRHRGGPDVMAPVWAAIDTELAADRPSIILAELELLRNVAYTHPRPLTERLETLRHRLNSSPPAPNIDLEDARDTDIYRSMYGLPPIDADDIRHELPQLYTNAAKAEPALLDTALDALWDLRRRDRRPINQHSNSAARLIEDELANLLKIPMSVANVVVDRVEAWLADTPRPDDVSTPLFALKPLLAKEGNQFHAETRWKWVIRPYSINPDAVTDLRARIRQLITGVAQGADPGRAAAAIKLLEDALRQPHGYQGNRPSEDTLRNWDDDSIALFDAARTIAEGTNEPLVRRLIRAAIGWHADHAMSARVQHKALELTITLDNIDTLDENLAEAILHPELGTFSPSRRDTALPTVERLEADRSTARAAAEQTSDNKTGAHTHDLADSTTRIEALLAESATRLNEVVTQLLSLDDEAIIDKLSDTLIAAIAWEAKQHPRVGHIATAIADAAPERLPAMIDAATNLPLGPLDHELDTFIAGWLRHDPAAATTWLQTTTQRPAGRRAIGAGFSHYTWLVDYPALESIFQAGIADTNETVRNAFLRSGGAYLAQDPEHAPGQLLDAGITPADARAALEQACGYDGPSWGTTLNEAAATAVLDLIAHIGYAGHSFVISRITGGVAANHPRRVLEHLAALESTPLDDDTEELAAAYRTHANTLAEWLRDAALNGRSVRQSTGVALSYGISFDQAIALTAQLSHLDQTALKSFVDNLSDVEIWPTEQPELTAAVYERARELESLVELQPLIRAAMTPHTWGGTNGESEELNQAVEQLTRAIADTTDPDVLANYQDALTEVTGTIIWSRQRHEEDRDNDF